MPREALIEQLARMLGGRRETEDVRGVRFREYMDDPAAYPQVGRPIDGPLAPEQAWRAPMARQQWPRAPAMGAHRFPRESDMRNSARDATAGPFAAPSEPEMAAARGEILRLARQRLGSGLPGNDGRAPPPPSRPLAPALDAPMLVAPDALRLPLRAALAPDFFPQPVDAPALVMPEGRAGFAPPSAPADVMADYVFDPDREWAEARARAGPALDEWRRQQRDLRRRGIPRPGAPAISQVQMRARSRQTEAPIDQSRPMLRNDDGTFSTEETITIESGGRFYNIPTIVSGRRLSEDAAVEAWRQGRNSAVGSFGSLDDAVSAARLRSDAIGRQRRPQDSR